MKKLTTNKPIAKKPTAKKPTAAMRKRESALLLKLQAEHGYTMGNLSPKDRIGMMFDFTGKTLRAVRFVKLAVPADSALGLALSETGPSDKPKSKPQTLRKSSQSPCGT